MSTSKLISAILTSAIASSNLIMFAPKAEADTPTDSQEQKAQAGFRVPDTYLQSVNQLQITKTIYTGECPGEELQTQKVVFFSDKTPTAEDRRVIITNVTGSENQEVNLEFQPYTDREYQDEQGSEDIKVSIGEKHDDGKFVVFEGENKFKYEIVQIEEQGDRELETVIEEGYFSAQVEENTEYEERDELAA